jgi:hypothetical protein
MSETQSVLDKMTAGIMGMKQERATQLTPVGMERSNPLPAIAEARGDVFPHDGGIQDQIVFSAKIIRENLFQMQTQLAGMEECLRSIEREAGLAEPLTPVSTPAEPTFEEKYAAQQADAQAQAFTATPVVKGTDAWECPAHGSSNVVGLKSKKGRDYRKCTLCSEFERST